MELHSICNLELIYCEGSELERLTNALNAL